MFVDCFFFVLFSLPVIADRCNGTCPGMSSHTLLTSGKTFSGRIHKASLCYAFLFCFCVFAVTVG